MLTVSQKRIALMQQQAKLHDLECAAHTALTVQQALAAKRTQQYYIQCSAQRIVAWYKQGYYLKTNGKWYYKTATGAEYIKYSTA